MPTDRPIMSNEKRRVIQPRAATTPVGVREPTAAGRLPDEIITEQVQRLAVFAAMGAGLWTFGLVMDYVVMPLAVGTFVPRTNAIIESFAIVTSAALYAYVRLARQTPHTKIEVGLWYMIANALGVALLNTWARTPSSGTIGYVSW